jgi:hypothetical protein
MDLFTASVIALGASVSADAVTTELALKRPGIVEMNPFQQRQGVRLATHAGLAVALPLVERRYMKGHRKAAIVLNFGLAAGFAVISGSNVRLARW